MRDASSEQAEWPEVDFIVGNPPFLGGKLLRSALGSDYVDRLFEAYENKVPREADLVCYWFEKARSQIVAGKAKRAGLVATNSIRGGTNRKLLESIIDTVGMFMAWSDRPWILDGASVRVSMVGFGNHDSLTMTLDGRPVVQINADLTSSHSDITTAKRLKANQGIAFMADTKGGPFDIPHFKAAEMLQATNPDGRLNEVVVKPWANGKDITHHYRNMWIVDFGVDLPIAEAALYEAPFEYVKKMVKPMREQNRREQYRVNWWIHAEPRPAMRKALSGLKRYLATPVLAKHRLFVFLDSKVLPDHQLIVFARDDWFTFGVLQSKVHVCWALRQGTSLEDRPRYTPTTTFETFPFPICDEKGRFAISSIAEKLYQIRAAALQSGNKRTLTALYNEYPSWLRQNHEALDDCVLASYGWPKGISEEEIVNRLLDLNHDRSTT